MTGDRTVEDLLRTSRAAGPRPAGPPARPVRPVRGRGPGGAARRRDTVARAGRTGQSRAPGCSPWPPAGSPTSGAARAPAGTARWRWRCASRRTPRWRRRPTRSRRPGDADDTLTLLFLCCHPALPGSAQVALTLRAVGGLSTAQIARAHLVPEATMSQRIRRAKQRIEAAGARFTMPEPAERDERLRSVLRVLYLIFNEGYTASEWPGPAPGRADRRGDPAGPHPARAAARRRRGGRAAGADAAHRRAPGGPARPGRGTGAPRRAGPHPLGPGRHRGGDRADHRGVDLVAAGPVPAPGGDRRRARRGARRRRRRTGGRSSRSTDCWPGSRRTRWSPSTRRWRWPWSTGQRAGLALLTR